MGKKLTTEVFIKRAEKVHGDRYEYSLVEYKNNCTKVKIVCKEHGLFEQRPEKHMKGHGCNECSSKKLSVKFSKDTKEFIQQANRIHNYFYDYSLVEYKNNYTKVSILCPKHGIFQQEAKSHLNGNICKKCSFEKQSISKNMGKSMFIKKAKNIHGDKFDYSFVEYKNINTKVKILCKQHDAFKQTPTEHIHRSRNCPKCANSLKGNKKGKYSYDYFNIHKNDKLKKGCIYLFKIVGNNEIFLKVGISSKDANFRTPRIKNKGYDLILLIEKEMNLFDAFELEQNIINEFNKYIPKLNFSGHTECIELNDEVIKKLENINV